MLLDFKSSRKGHQFRLRFLAGPAGLDSLSKHEWFGPMKPWQQVEVLTKPTAAVRLGRSAPSGLEYWLDPALREALHKMRNQG